MSRIALVTRARAPYHKALQEAFAESLGKEETLKIFYPRDSWTNFSEDLAIPAAPNISVEWVASKRVSGNAAVMLARYRTEAIGTQLPSGALWNALQAYRPEVVWIHEFSPYTLTGLWFARRRRIPVVVSTDVGQANSHSFPFMVRLWHRLWGSLVDGIIACTPAARQPLCGIAMPVVEAYHAADSRKFLPITSDHQRNGVTQFVYVGRIIPIKGIDLLLAAVSRLKQAGNIEWKLKLIGPETDHYGSALIERHGLQREVEITGRKEGDELRREFSQGDAFVIASRQDTYGAVVHEAACLGLPLLVSRHAGAAEALVSESKNGFAIEPRDTADFATRLQALCDRHLRARMSAECKKTAELFSAHRRGPAVRAWLRENFAT